MTQVERVSAILLGQLPDRPPVSFWHHFSPDECYGRAAVDAHLRHLARFGLDLLKVMNDNPYPAAADIHGSDDLRNLSVLRGDEEGYGRQLELIRSLKAELAGRVMMVTTLFNAWAVLRRIVTPKHDRRHRPPTLGGPPAKADTRLRELLAEDKAAVAEALGVIAASQAGFARRCIEAGADGVFLSVRDEWAKTETNGSRTYAELVRPGDLEILAAAQQGRCNILHVCGIPQDLAAFATYPVAVINWADRAAGPAIAEVAKHKGPAIAGGVDNLGTLPNGRPEDVATEVADAVQQAGDHPLIVAPGCTYDPDGVPVENLEAMVRAAAAVRRG